MVRPFRFAVQATNLSEHDLVVSSARQAEDLGYQELYSYDHLGTVDPFVPLVVAAEATSALRVGPLVLNNEFHHPALLARTVATADRMTGGRVVLGVGTGYAQSEHDAMSIELRPPGARVDRFEESLLALRSLLDHGSVETQGDHHRLAIVDLGVRPIQARVPLLVGGHGRRVIEIAARLADIFQFTGFTHGPDGVPQASAFRPDAIIERSRWLTEAAGDRDRAVERSVLVQRTVIGEGAEAAVDHACRRLGLARDVVESTPFLLFGSLGRVVDRLQSLRDSVGISHFVVREAADFAPVVATLSGR